MKCIKCGGPTIGDNLTCDDCRDYEYDDEFEFHPCSRCDGHQACEDFGCAIDLGLERMVKKELGDDW